MTRTELLGTNYMEFSSTLTSSNVRDKQVIKKIEKSKKSKEKKSEKRKRG